MVDLEDELADVLGPGGPVSHGQVDEAFWQARAEDAEMVAAAFSEAGWYDGGAQPFHFPTTPIDAPRTSSPVVRTVRRLWLARFNPASPDWFDGVTGESGSDVADEALFPWSRPDHAVRDGNFWLSTYATPRNRFAIEELLVGDLVVIQRSDPGKDHPALRGRDGATDVLVGVAIAFAAEEWDDSTSGLRERRVGLLPAAKFKWRVPRRVARAKKRLQGDSFSKMPQHPDGRGPMGFTLSSVVGDHDINEVFAVCGIHPEALAEPDLSRLAARLKATALGNKPLWQFRWDHVYRHSIRTQHERDAVRRCKAWADRHGFVFRSSAELVPLAGYDLLFVDAKQDELQVEVKGYAARDLAFVKLQRSQEVRATDAAKGIPPDWRLFAVLDIDKTAATELVLKPQKVLELIASGGLQVR